MLEASAVAGTRGGARNLPSEKVLPNGAARAESWPLTMRDKLQLGESWRKQCQVRKWNLWGDCEVTKAAMPQAMPSSPSTTPLQRGHCWCLCRDGTNTPRDRVRGSHPCLPSSLPQSRDWCQDCSQPSDTRAEGSTAFPEEPLPCCCQCRDKCTTCLLRQGTVVFILMLSLLWAFYLFTADACPCWD